ncbi:hypothetical protein [Chroococcus sp. FPU101]|uniref:hypothetical protein n=1 Tax=Chroococcus sp. FPU101 TaxID=1974212 RepID=UPI001A8F8482|nr:hypothetical protein [Chroococcus sp. FPU101]GFE69026.1 hypothetical protein CFPU101_16360 [Chroococcus sp. FPU101]
MPNLTILIKFVLDGLINTGLILLLFLWIHPFYYGVYLISNSPIFTELIIGILITSYYRFLKHLKYQRLYNISYKLASQLLFLLRVRPISDKIVYHSLLKRPIILLNLKSLNAKEISSKSENTKPFGDLDTKENLKIYLDPLTHPLNETISPFYSKYLKIADSNDLVSYPSTKKNLGIAYLLIDLAELGSFLIIIAQYIAQADSAII